MPFSDMAAVVCGEDQHGLQISLSMTIARQLSAYVVGINIVEETGALGLALEAAEHNFWPLSGSSVSPHTRWIASIDVAASDQMKERIIDRIVSAYDCLEADFYKTLRGHALRGEWHTLFSPELSSLMSLARRVDFILLPDISFGQPQGRQIRLVHDLLVLSGRPLLRVAPTGRTFNCPGTILVGWDGSDVANRAVRAALPLLQRAHKLEFVTVDGLKNEDSTASVIAHLRRHGISALCVSRRSAGRTVAETLVAYAEEANADLLVAGAYSHSRIKELVIGSTTRELIRKSMTPLFLCH